MGVLNEWQKLFWDSDLSYKHKKHIIRVVQDWIKPLYAVTIVGKALQFDKIEDVDENEIFADRLDKVLGNRFHWESNYELQKLINHSGDDSADQKVLLALKKSPEVLPIVAALKSPKSVHTEETMLATLESIFGWHQASSTGYTDSVRNDIWKILKVFSRSYDQPISIKSIVSYLAKSKYINKFHSLGFKF